MYSDEELVLGCINGCQKCHTILFNRYYKKSINKIRTFHPDIQVIEDIVIESFSKAFSSLNTLNDYAKFPQWFGKLLKNHALHTIILKESNKKRKIISLDRPLKLTKSCLDTRLFATSYNNQTPKEIHQNPIIDYDMDIIMNEINSLPPYMSKCLLGQLDGHKLKEIGKNMNITVGTVKGYTYRSRERLKKIKYINDDYSYLMRP